jgi:hypothetical protein
VRICSKICLGIEPGDAISCDTKTLKLSLSSKIGRITVLIRPSVARRAADSPAPIGVITKHFLSDSFGFALSSDMWSTFTNRRGTAPDALAGCRFKVDCGFSPGHQHQRRFRVPYWNGHTGARAILLFGDLVLNATICPTRRSTKTLRSCASCRQIATAQNNSPPEPSSSTGCALSSARRFSLAAAASRSATAFASTQSRPISNQSVHVLVDPVPGVGAKSSHELEQQSGMPLLPGLGRCWTPGTS